MKKKKEREREREKAKSNRKSEISGVDKTQIHHEKRQEEKKMRGMKRTCKLSKIIPLMVNARHES